MYSVYQFTMEKGNYDCHAYDDLESAMKDFLDRKLEPENGPLYLDYHLNDEMEEIAIRRAV